MHALSELSKQWSLGRVSGRGLLVALDLKHDIAEHVVADALAHGLLLNAPRPSLIRFMPALNVTRAEIDTMVGMLDQVLSEQLG